MHIEFLTEDSSARTLLDAMVPKLIGVHGAPHTWRIHFYKGVGRLPRGGLKPGTDPKMRILLDQLPRILRGYGKTPGIDKIVVVLDADDRDCVVLLRELKNVARQCGVRDKTMYRLAIEEIEAWYLGDREALRHAYPSAKGKILSQYAQDSVCGTWELLADALVAGGVAAVKRNRGPRAGDLKHEWARAIGPLMAPDRNLSPSFAKLRDGLRQMTQTSAP